MRRDTTLCRMSNKTVEIENSVLKRFWSRKSHVVIPMGIRVIGQSAFFRNDMRKVSIPGSVKYIGYGAFYKCRSLHELTVPPSVEYIGKHAFGEYFFFKYIEGFKFPYEEHRKYHEFRMYCEKGSAAEQYAWENDLTYYT